MKKTILTPTTLTAIAICIIGLCINISANIQGGELRTLAMAGLIIVETIVFGIVGCLFLIHKDLRPIGQGIFIGLGLNLVIGFSVCTML
jgi:hypothetical protein